MPRPRRIDFPGAWHHVWQRGARRASIFKEDLHCELFLDVLDRAVRRLGLEVHAYALMPNHYHLLLRSALGNLSRCMQLIDGVYTQEVNRLHPSWDGPVFRGRFRNQVVSDDAYLEELLAYLHLNPVRARLVSSPEEDCWTSHQAYVGLARRPRFLTTEVLLKMFGGAAAIEKFVTDRRLKRTEWPEEMDLATGGLRTPKKTPDDDPATARETRAKHDGMESILTVVCRVAGVEVADLLRVEMGPHANPARRLAVLALAKWTAASHRAIGQRLGMSTRQVAKVLERNRRQGSPLMKEWLRGIEDHVSSGGV
jgi:REP element-mobilizing transposase RayT/DNA-directed RNA polymerase specialized sigma24 family protein